MLERQQEAGGVPRYCSHSPFGFREFRRCLTGPQYARRLIRQAIDYGVDIQTQTSVIRLSPQGCLQLSKPSGSSTINAKKVLIATGVRETPRAPRLISGQRPQGITTTGALQSTVLLTREKFFEHPVIIGTELVAFSALLTCLKAGIRPMAMIEQNSRVTAWRPVSLLARVLRVPILRNTRLAAISGKAHVTGVVIQNRNKQEKEISKEILCDGVIFTGKFTPEASLIRSSHLEFDPKSGGPTVDQYGRCSDSDFFATGNLTHPVETSGWCWREAKQVAKHIKHALDGNLPGDTVRIPIQVRDNRIRYITPQVFAGIMPGESDRQSPKQESLISFQLRFSSTVKGTLSMHWDHDESPPFASKFFNTLPERRAILSIAKSCISISPDQPKKGRMNKILIRFSPQSEDQTENQTEARAGNRAKT